MISQSITENFRRLSPDEKLRVLEELWSEVAEEYAAMPLSESHRRLLDERLELHAEKPDDIESWDSVRDNVLDEL